MSHSFRMLLVLLLFTCYCSTSTNAQSKLQGLVINGKSEPLSEATVLLLNSRDSSLVKGLLTKTGGLYAFENVSPGKYIVSASFSGYKQVYSPIVHVEENQSKSVEALTLSEKISSLQEVTVATKKPLLSKRLTGW